MLIWDPNYLSPTNGVTGWWRPYSVGDITNPTFNASGFTVTIGAMALTGSPNVTIANPLLAVSGGTLSLGGWVGLTGAPNVTAMITGNPLVIASVAITGSPNVTIANALLAVSGNAALTNTLLAVSGNATLLNALLATSGNSTITNPVLAVSGNTTVVNTAPLPFSGIATVLPLTGGFSPVFTGITGGQIQIPLGVKSYTVSAISGNVWVQDILLVQGTSVNGGRYGGGFLSNYALNVGCTGGYALIYWET